MKLFVFHALWLLSIGLRATDKIEATLLQTLSKAHAAAPSAGPSLLKNFDPANPLFILK